MSHFNNKIMLETLITNTYKIDLPVNIKNNKMVRVFSYQTNKAYEFTLENSENIRLKTFSRILHQTDIDTEDDSLTGGVVEIIDEKVV